MLFYVFRLFLLKHLFTFDIVKTTDCKSSSSSKSKTVHQPYRGDFKKLPEVFSFLFFYNINIGDDKGASFIIFSNNLKNYQS